MRISDWSSDVCSSDLPVIIIAQLCGSGTGDTGSSPLCTETSSRYQSDGSCRKLNCSVVVADVATPEKLSCVQGITPRSDRKSVVEGKSVSVRVYLGGRRLIKKKNRVTYRHNSQ